MEDLQQKLAEIGKQRDEIAQREKEVRETLKRLEEAERVLKGKDIELITNQILTKVKTLLPEPTTSYLPSGLHLTDLSVYDMAFPIVHGASWYEGKQCPCDVCKRLRPK
jgi:uncharacterized membrane protein (DUF106 family)